MVARRALAAAGCSQCRSVLLNHFTTSLRAGPVARTPLSRTRFRPIGPAATRPFSSFPTPGIPASDRDPVDEQLETKEETDRDEENSTAHESQPADVPWYLQVDPPRHVASMEPPPLPEVPQDSPPIIGSLLEYASEEMGLDELNLLDLRELDPPPALGPNLFMLFGTARSERHLNVSAGRLLRWLRAKHRVYADADGLLGPNERKTKVRRKTKRAKLLGTMGTDDADDGIRTGWICVNLGTIGRGGQESAVVSDDGRVAGFGVAQQGSTVVVQIMTESRRAEMGLETLWQRALDRSSPQAPNSEPKGEVEHPKSMHPLDRAIVSSSVASRSSDEAPNGYPSGAARQNQARFYSTQRIVHGQDPLLDAASAEALGQTLMYDPIQKQRLLGLLRTHLDELSPAEICTTLGESESGQVPTPFLQLMDRALQSLPPTKTWVHRLAVQTRARESGHRAATESLDDVRVLLEEMRLYGIRATRDQCLQLLTCIYCTVKTETREQSELALELFEVMHQRGQSIIATDIVVTIIDSISRISLRGARQDRELIARLDRLLLEAKLPCMDEALLMKLMRAYARLGHWEGVWNTWRVPPRYLRPRSAGMYVGIYRLAASTRSAPMCTTTLRRCFQEMLMEDPPVRPVGQVRMALMECIRVADPRAEEHAETLPVDASGQVRRLAIREFVRLVKNIKLLS
ncbi:Uu.00g018350.m01.CDS01 [Anthostomella pinea]|uniref:ATPase synthesis protein 25 n=1 Tax=Anthostomella pinea TaxID=933095 RepID=A0AAI8YQQ7_9PEZI|nr:Uu.00g018350.m01.CDS01 [Anthostomella pinea]